MIIFIRHAERGDNQIPMKLSEIPYDPPIIDAAQQTIYNTSQSIAHLLKKNNIQNIRICSSKFLRCLMTARGLQRSLKEWGFSVDEEYELDDRICEFLREDWFKEYPLPRLIYKTEHASKYIGQLKYKQNNLNLKFPQSYPLFHHRITAFKDSLVFPQDKNCLLVVTHGFVVRELSFRMIQPAEFQKQVKYCGYFAYKSQKEKGQILLQSKL